MTTLVEEAVERLKRRRLDALSLDGSTEMFVEEIDDLIALLAALPTDDDVTEEMIEAGNAAFRENIAGSVAGLDYRNAITAIYRAMRGAAIHTLIGRATNPAD